MKCSRSRECTVLESTNPDPSTNGYSRVVSWIDEETLGIVHAEAYDAQNKLLKEFDPKSFKKVNGQWELQEMEIRNVQTGSRSRIEFDLKRGELFGNKSASRALDNGARAFQAFVLFMNKMFRRDFFHRLRRCHFWRADFCGG